MKKLIPALAAAAALTAARGAHATPSTTFWTPATTYVQPFGIPHLTYDTYVQSATDLPMVTGLTIGVLPYTKLQAEIGFDLLFPAGDSVNPLQLNAKVGTPEGSIFKGSPGLSAGVFGIGFEEDVTDPTIVHGEISKLLPVVGTVAVGGYYAANETALIGVGSRSSEAGFEPENAGFMASWTSRDWNLNLPGLQKIVGTADIMTGDNALGAWGVGTGLYFTPAIALLTGPVFFLEPELQPNDSDWMWSFQVDVDFDLMRKKEATK